MPPPSDSPRTATTPGVLGGHLPLAETADPPETWVDLHGDALYRYALSRVKDRSVAEDLVQETFVAALEGGAAFRGQSQFRTWLVGVLRHKIHDSTRKTARERTPDAADDDESAFDGSFGPDGRWIRPPGKWSVDAGSLTGRREFWDAVARCAAAVPGRAGDVFALRTMGEMPATEVCKVLEITATHLWVLLHRARARMRACLETTWFDPPLRSSRS